MIHRFVGYPTAFVIAPVALFSFAGARTHRRWGQAYLCLMVFLYLTGAVMTLTRHPWASWEFARNVLFNFFGFSLVLYGYRAMFLLYGRKDPEPARLDWILAGVLFSTTAGLVLLNLKHDTPMRAYAIVATVFSVLEIRDLRRAFRPKEILFTRHLRYMLGSYYYVMTVLSIVHLQALPRNVKWLWPMVLGTPVVILAMNEGIGWLRSRRSKAMGYAVGFTLCVVATLGLYIATAALRGDPTVFPNRTAAVRGFR